ncbi:substrate-binding domain-containing protein, partial [Peptococcaceae bacterium]|nr:substrate-binding domain-containing protein [Peptococcaceae bacterium]
GVSMTDMQRDGNQAIKKAFDEAAKRDGVKVIWQDAQGDPVKQQKDIQKLIEEKMQVVVLQVIDPVAGNDMVRQLFVNNIRVIALETLPVNTPVDGYITSDHSRAGYLQVHYLRELLQAVAQQAKRGMVTKPQPGQQQVAAALKDGKPLQVVVLQGDPDDQRAREITAAVNSELQKLEQAELALSTPHPRWDDQLAKLTMEQLLGDQPNIDVVLANDSKLAMAAVEVLKKKDLAHRVITVGAGASPPAIKALVAGEHDAEVDGRPEILGRLAYDAAVSIAEGKFFQYDKWINNGDHSIPAKIIPPRLIRQENAYLLQERLEGGGQGGGGGEQEGGGDQGGGGGEQEGGGDQGGGEQEGGQGGDKGGKKTILKITTVDGKEVEIEIEGEIKSIKTETKGGGGGGDDQGGGQQGEQ